MSAQPFVIAPVVSSESSDAASSVYRWHYWRYRISSLEALKSLNDYYHDNVCNIPGFLLNEIYPTKGRENLWDLAAFVNNPHLFAQDHVQLPYGRQGYVLMPNIERHSDKVLLMCSKDIQKRRLSKEKRTGGISYTVWALHPTVLDAPEHLVDGSPDTCPMGKRNSFDIESAQRIREQLEARPGLERIVTRTVATIRTESFAESVRTPAQTRVRAIEMESRVKYLVTILDLTYEELPWLLAVRAHASEHMTKYYDLGVGDDLLMYFHFPTSEATSTLHLHVTVNWTMQVAERVRSFTLDEIIDHLQSGHADVHKLVFQRQSDNNLHGLVAECLVDVVKNWAEATSGENLVMIENGIFESSPEGWSFEPACSTVADTSLMCSKTASEPEKDIDSLPREPNTPSHAAASGFVLMGQVIDGIARSQSSALIEDMDHFMHEIIRKYSEPSHC